MNAANTKIQSLERTIKTLNVEIEELRQLKITLEGSVSGHDSSIVTMISNILLFPDLQVAVGEC